MRDRCNLAERILAQPLPPRKVDKLGPPELGSLTQSVTTLEAIYTQLN